MRGEHIFHSFLRSTFYVPRVCDDPEVQMYLRQHFFEFNPEHAVTADEVVEAARQKFGSRCDSIEFWSH